MEWGPLGISWTSLGSAMGSISQHVRGPGVMRMGGWFHHLPTSPEQPVCCLLTQGFHIYTGPCLPLHPPMDTHVCPTCV